MDLDRFLVLIYTRARFAVDFGDAAWGSVLTLAVDTETLVKMLQVWERHFPMRLDYTRASVSVTKRAPNVWAVQFATGLTRDLLEAVGEERWRLFTADGTLDVASAHLLQNLRLYLSPQTPRLEVQRPSSAPRVRKVVDKHDADVTESLTFTKQQVSRLMGHDGHQISEIRTQAQCNIWVRLVPLSQRPSRDTPQQVLVLGSPEQVERAKLMLAAALAKR